MGRSTGGTGEVSEWKPEKEGRCWYKKWKVSRGHNDSRIRKLGAVETAITDHKFERVVDIKPIRDCISSTIKHHLIVQDEYLSSIKKPMILFSSPPSPPTLFLITCVDLGRASLVRSSAGVPDTSMRGAGGDHH